MDLNEGLPQVPLAQALLDLARPVPVPLDPAPLEHPWAQVDLAAHPDLHPAPLTVLEAPTAHLQPREHPLDLADLAAQADPLHPRAAPTDPVALEAHLQPLDRLSDLEALVDPADLLQHQALPEAPAALEALQLTLAHPSAPAALVALEAPPLVRSLHCCVLQTVPCPCHVEQPFFPSVIVLATKARMLLTAYAQGKAPKWHPLSFLLQRS